MNEIGIGEALEKLIEVLQLEGHELFRIFTEVQPVIAICNAIIVFVGISGAILSGIVVYKIGKKRDWFHNSDEVEIILICVLVALLGGLVSALLALSITDIFLRINYPEYFAAKELIGSLSFLAF